MKGKWAQGIPPRHFAWIIQDQLAICERPGGYGANHRKVRRQEEIIWIREQGFGRVISLLTSPHNLHAYDELGVSWEHLPFAATDDLGSILPTLYGLITDLRQEGMKVIIHHDDLGDRLVGAMAGYLVFTGMVPEPPRAIALIERIVGRQLGPAGREVVTASTNLAR